MDFTTLLIVAVFALALGFFSGRLMGQVRDKPAANEPDDVIRGDHLIVELDPQSGKAKVHFNKHIHTHRDTLNPHALSELMVLLRELKAWVGVPDVKPKVEVEPAAYPPAETHPREEYEILEEEEPAAEKTRLTITGVLSRALSAEIKSVDLTPKSVAAQVDAILQKKLTGTPLGARGIRLMEFPDKGMVVLVGLEKYNEVDSVPDPEIRALIKQAVAEWEDKMLGTN
jgi:hypothetical protein